MMSQFTYKDELSKTCNFTVDIIDSEFAVKGYKYSGDFLIAYNIDETVHKVDCNEIQGEDQSVLNQVLVIRVEIESSKDESNQKRYKLKQEDYQKNSMKFRHQRLRFALEYKCNKILLTLDPTEILITENWQFLRRISNGSENNMSQNYLHRHPQFDIVKFPFIVVSGLEHYSLVNVKDFFAQEFIISSSNTNRGQRSFFFKKEKYGYSFHFSSFELAASNVVHHKWHEMQLKNDYFEKLE